MDEKSTEAEMPRSKLSKASIIKWLRTRYRNQSRKNHSYLYFPQDLIRETSIQQIFKDFDADGSGGLSRDQVFDMFNGFGIQITMENLDTLYDSVEVNLEELDCDMFKKCALSEKSNKVFCEIVKGLPSGNYLPHNFTNMIIYLVYLSKREELKKVIQVQKCSIREKVSTVESLLKLKGLSLNNDKLKIKSNALKSQLKSKFRDIWQKVNEKYGQKFAFTPKMEEEFHQFYHRQKVQKGVNLDTIQQAKDFIDS